MKIMSYEKFVSHKSLIGYDITKKQKREIIHVLDFFERDQGKTVKVSGGIATLRRLILNGVDSLMLRRLIRNTKFSKAITLKKMITLYGKEKGKVKYDNWCYSNKISNTYEYKKEKLGWTKEQFDEFNKSRAVTKENLILRHGEEKGIEMWNNYVARQRYAGCKLEYFKEKHGEVEGEKIYKQLATKKSNNLQNFIKKYGEEIGKQKYENWISSYLGNGYSKISQELFWRIYDKLTEEEKEKTYFAELNKEFFCYESHDKGKLFDFVNTELMLVVEFNGDLYHGNPKKYKPNDQPLLFLKNELSCEEIWNNDKKKNLLMENQGYRVIIIWEMSYKEDKEQCLNYILNVIQEQRKLLCLKK